MISFYRRISIEPIHCILFMHVPVYIDTLIKKVVEVWGQPIMAGTLKEAFQGDLHPDLVPTAETREFCFLIRTA